VLTEFGLLLPVDTEIRVWDANSERRYLVLPRRPEHTEGMTEDELTGLVTRNGLIGTAAV
jgi:nitrile hydratase